MTDARAKEAADLLNFYFKRIFTELGFDWETANEAEIRLAVYGLLAAARDEALTHA